MKKYYTFLDNVICLEFPVDVHVHTLRQHIPGIKETYPQKEDIIISFSQSNESNFIYDFNTFTIYNMWHDSWLIDLPHLIYSYLKYVFFHKSIYFVHSCLVNGNLFIGPSGSGKTTLCIAAIKEKLSLSSLDRTCVTFKNEQLITLSGTDILSVRHEEIQPSLVIYDQSQDRNLYEYDIKPNEVIESISLFQLNTTYKRKQIEGLSVVHQLFPYFIDSIKSDCFVQHGKMLFSPHYCDIKKKALFNALAKLSIPVYFSSGSIADILFDNK